jgi:RNA polymerase sigma-70 factor (ECF subfamily)
VSSVSPDPALPTPPDARQAHQRADAPNGLARRLEEARSGSREALGELFNTCRNYLLLVANQESDTALWAKQSPSDLVQETLIEAQRRFGTFRGQSEAELLSWLTQILLTRIVDVSRRYKVAVKRNIAREVPLDSQPLDGHTAPHRIANSPAQRAIAEEESQQVNQALGRLSEEHRRVIELRNWELRSFEEIGTILGRSEDAARKLWSRAVQRLGKELEQLDDSR